MIKKKANVGCSDKDNLTPLILAAAEGNAEAVGRLIQNGANIFSLDSEEKSALYWAAAQNHIKVVQVFLKDYRSRALIKLSDRNDNTPLHIAAEQGFINMVIELCNAGADLGARNEDERTPLHMAAKEGRNGY